MPRSEGGRRPTLRGIRSIARATISAPAIKVIGSRVRLDDVLPSRARTDSQGSCEFASQGRGPEEAIEEDRKGRDFRMRLVAHRDIPVDQVEEFPWNFLGADDEQQVLPRDARQHV